MDGNNLNQPDNIQNQNNAENRNNNVENQNNIQPNPVANDLNSINNVAEEEQIKNRPVMTNEEISRQAEIATAAMDDAKLHLRGSKEYDNAYSEFQKAQELWKQHNPNEPYTSQDAMVIRNQLLNSLYMIDNYLGKKYRENDKSYNATKRMRAMETGFNLLEEQVYAMNVELEKMEAQKPYEMSSLAVISRAANNQIGNAKLTLRGSDEFKNAAESFETVTNKIEEINKKHEGRESEITSAELDELNSLIDKSSTAILIYDSMKLGNTLGDNTHKRTEAMTRARSVLENAKRKVTELQEAKEKAPEKSFADLKEASAENNIAIQDAEKDVHLGSDEYKNAKNDYKAFSEMLDKFANAEDEPTRREIDDLNRLAEKSAKSIDTYLKGKYGEKLGEKTQKRVDAMRKSRENVAEVQKKCKAALKFRMENATKENIDTIRTTESQVLKDVNTAKTSVNGSKVWFGGEDYNTAVDLFQKAVQNEVRRDAARENAEPSYNSINAQIRELKNAQDATRVYIERKEKEMKDSGKKLDDKGAKRLEEMRKAYDCLGKRIDRAQAKYDAMDAKEKEEATKKMDDFVNKKRAEVVDKSGVKRIMAIHAQSNARALRDMANKKSLTALDQERVRYAAASLMLQSKIENGTILPPKPPTLQGYEAMVKAVSQSKEFRSVLDGLITPVTARRFITNPKMLENLDKRFTDNLRESYKKGQTKSKNMVIKVEKEETLNNNGPKK